MPAIIDIIAILSTLTCCVDVYFYQHALTLFFSFKIVLIDMTSNAVELLLHMGLINKVDMVCLSPLGYGV